MHDNYLATMIILKYFDRTVVISAGTLMPVLGVTWIIGLFAVNEHTEVFAWIFAVLNSLQVSMLILHANMIFYNYHIIRDF